MEAKNWKKLLPGCFAGMDAPFGVHPNDEKRALRMFHVALHQRAKMADILSETRKYLRSRGANESRIKYQMKLIKEFKANPLKNIIQKKKAWLVTWEGTQVVRIIHPKNVVAVFDPRISSDRVKEFIELYYISSCYSLFEKVAYSTQRKNNPYPAEYSRINGVLWLGMITCGHNPFLQARIVENLVVTRYDTGREEITWNEIPPPSGQFRYNSSLTD